MSRKDLLAKIEVATAAIGDAEEELQKALADSAAAHHDEEEVGEVVRAASVRLKAAEEKLTDLEKSLALAKIEEANARVETAKGAITDAEADLEKVLDQMQVATPLQETWVSEVVEAAFTKLRTAKKELVDLEESIATDNVGGE